MPKTKSEPKKLKQANKSPNQKQQPILSAAQRRAKAKRTLTIFGVAVAVILGLVIYFGFGLNTLQERGDMKNYLEERYKEEFVVNNVRTEGAGLGVPGEQVGDAHKIDDDNIVFEVSKTRRGYSDRYPQELWSYQERKALRPILESLIGSDIEYVVQVWPKLIPGGTTPETIPAGSILDVQDALVEYRDILSYSLTIKADINGLGDAPTSRQLANAFEATKIVKAKNVDAKLYYLYRSSSHDDNGEDVGGYKYRISLDNAAIDAVDTPEDIGSYYKRSN